MNIVKHLRIPLLFLLSFVLVISCEEDDSLPVENELTLNIDSAFMNVGNQITLTPRYGSVQLPQKTYEWTVSDTNIIVVEMNEATNEGIVTAVSEGQATATIRSTDGALEASAIITTDLIRETDVTLPEMITAYTQTDVTVSPEFNNVDFPIRDYNWTSNPAGIVEVVDVDDDDYDVTIRGLVEGSTTLTITSTDGELTASTTVNVLDENDGILKVLTIGNSFSEDAVETYLYPLAEATGKEIVIGNMYIGGESLAGHLENAQQDAAEYSYRKIDIDGNHNTASNVSLADGIADENWDYISFQQVSQDSGIFSTFEDPLPALQEYVSNEVENEFTKYLLHKTWAYAQNSTHTGFANYNNDQITMFTAIVDAYNQAEGLIPTYMTIPAGTGVQNGRTSYLGDNFTRDGYHLNEIGKFVAAGVWYEMLFGETVVDNPYMPDGMNPYDIEIAKEAAHQAVLNPDAVTTLTDYQETDGTGILTDDVFINFSVSSTAEGWNEMSGFLADTSIPDILYPNNEFSGITATITERFNGQNTNGATTTSTNLNMPTEVSQYSFFGNPGGSFGGNVIEQSVVVFSGFESDDTYEFCFFGSRMGVSDNRETQFSLTGANSDVGYLEVANNENNIVCVSGIQPDANGEIELVVTAGPNNTNGLGFYYLAAMSISPE